MDSPGKKKLLNKALKGFIILNPVLAAALFIPAWTINYINAWVFIIIFSGFVLFNIIYFFKKDEKLLERRLHGGPAVEKEKSQKIIQVCIRIFFPSMLVTCGLDKHFLWSGVPLILSLISFLFIIIGFAIVFFVLKENTFTSSSITVHEQTVISTGPYAVVRHPMCTGLFLCVNIWFYDDSCLYFQAPQ
jgi:protein-S-isoprenylcysteine O-methyltransferase Ste14